MFLGSAIFALSAAHSASVKSERNFCMWLIENVVSKMSSQFSLSLYLPYSYKSTNTDAEVAGEQEELPVLCSDFKPLRHPLVSLYSLVCVVALLELCVQSSQFLPNFKPLRCVLASEASL